MKDELLEAAYLAGFNASGEGYNGEFPFDDRDQKPQHDPAWCKDKDNAITAIKQARSAPTVQVSPLEFVTMVMEKEHLVGKPLFWAEWPNKENT